MSRHTPVQRRDAPPDGRNAILRPPRPLSDRAGRGRGRSSAPRWLAAPARGREPRVQRLTPGVLGFLGLREVLAGELAELGVGFGLGGRDDPQVQERSRAAASSATPWRLGPVITAKPSGFSTRRNSAKARPTSWTASCSRAWLQNKASTEAEATAERSVRPATWSGLNAGSGSTESSRAE